MKYLVGKIFIFGLALVPVFISAGLIYSLIFAMSFYSEQSLHLSPETKIAFFGDSHAMTSFDPQRIPYSFNGALNSETIFQSYSKITKICDANPQLKSLVISLSFHNLARAGNTVLYGEKYFPVYNNWCLDIIEHSDTNGELDHYYKLKGKANNFINLTIHKAIIFFLRIKQSIGMSSNFYQYLKYFNSILDNKKNLNYHPLFAGVYKSHKSNISETTISEAILRHYGSTDSSQSTSGAMVESLKRLAKYCDQRSIKVYFVTTPLHPEYFKLIPLRCRSQFYKLMNEITTNFKNIQYLDYSELILPNSFYGDGDHLNIKGTEEFSNLLRKELLLN